MWRLQSAISSISGSRRCSIARWQPAAGARASLHSSDAEAAADRPLELKLHRADKSLRVTFADGRQFRYPAEYLRVESPAATVHSKQLVAGRQHVAIIGLQPVGNYAVRLVFDDLHESGLYTWPLLRRLGESKLANMREYIRALKKAGKSRDPKVNSRNRSSS
eukprot:TRINITY_DN3870_c0_g1_i3.p1 TRINITY_DN3870_c0_g1~~TRINITY_DN3870_c0_g1_i3.p1  ORF type:complete len:163 (+),score=43.66 TRINITY_DN3870_c0_g1_i3:141-629(+)